ncbi:MAG: hypothetical protein HW412_1753 [Bacteroidetes bacterium]|nr:hypothetical protein [Bacteroidota bacterium]
MTRGEIILWYQLKGKQVLGHKFRRQYSVGKYVVDFYCPKLHLAIEVDGLSHSAAGAMENDRQRQTDIEQYGISFLRFTDEQVMNRGDEVVEEIRNAVLELSRRTSPFSPPS